MGKKIRLGLVIVVFALFFCMFGISGEESEAARKDNEEVVSLIEYETSEIGEIFEVDEAYSYLPEIAKDYVATIYEETGEIIKTEKNKEKGEVYLNPAYVEYLVLDDVVKQEQDVIPLPNIIDYDYNDNNKSELNLESRFSLDNIDGVSRISSLKNQGSLGICWAFASAEQAESNIYMKKNINTKATSDYPIFSARQLDYAISIDGILNYDNSQNVTFMPQRAVGAGGTILDAPFIYSNGLAAVLNNEQGMVDDYSKDKKLLSSVLNYDKSQYEINKFILFPTFNFKDENSISSTFERQQYLIEKKAFLDGIKEAIVENGGAIITTQSPQHTCEAKNMITAYSGTRIIRVDSDCRKDSGHAMQIIGWDDNYNYEYQTCYGYNQLSQGYVTGHKNEYMSCSSNIKTVSGTGAWLVRNSWGNEGNGYDYVYVAYDSLSSDILSMSEFTEMKKVEEGGERKWDNVYRGPIKVTAQASGAYSYTYINDDYREVSIPEEKTEKLEKIKFFTYKGGGLKYNFYYTNNKGEWDYLKDKGGNNITVTTSYVGLLTADFSDYDIILDESIKNIGVTGMNPGIVVGSVAVFTSNIDTTPEIYMPDSMITLNSGAKLTNTILSKTRVIKANSTLDYKLYDGAENDKTAQYNLTVDDNKVAANNINSTLNSNALSEGLYALEISYGDAASDFVLVKAGNSNNVTIKYVADSNGEVDASSVTIDAVNGTPMVVKASTKNNRYKFKRWVDENEKEITTQDTLTVEMQKNRFGFYGGHTYKAEFEEKEEYRVKFNTNGGNSIEDVLVLEGEKLEEPDEPTKFNQVFKGWYKESDLINVWDFENEIVDGDMTLYAKWVDYALELNVDSVYNYDEDRGLINNVVEQTEVGDFIEKLTVNEPFTVKVFDKSGVELHSGSMVGTGSVIKIVNRNDNKLAKSIKNIIRGDVNGDAKISSSDYVLIKNHIMKGGGIEGIYAEAADFNESGEISASDYVKIKNKIMK